jgi:uncharacterized protein (TIGR02300 family)
MTSPRWGKKRTCLECGAAFYDMQRSPIACPKCGAKHEPVVLLKSDGRTPRKSRAQRPAPVAVEAEPEAVKEEAEATADDDSEVLEIDDENEPVVDEDSDNPAADDRDR